jgi:hypothetical protein
MLEGAACYNGPCRRLGSHFPIIHFAPPGRIPGQPFPYTLEVPRAACVQCQPHFMPEVFINAAARANMTEKIVDGGKNAPDFNRMVVTWHPLSDPRWMELRASNEARFWF